MAEQEHSPLHLTNPHDRFFRHFLADRERARAFLRHVLPPDVLVHLDLTRLTQEEGSFVDPELRAQQGDVLFRVRMKGGQRPVYVYVLFEHKSYPDRWVAWQLLRYMVRIWEREWQRERKLAPIVPVVVYHGVQGWTAPRAFEALVAAPEALRGYVPDFSYRLYDLNEVEDAVLWQEMVIGSWLAVMKYIQRPELEVRLEDIVRVLWRWGEVVGSETGIEALITVLRYVTEAREGLSEERVRAVVEKALPEGGEVMATLAQKWLEEGIQQGLQQGLVKARRDDVVALLRARLQPGEAWLEWVAEQLEAIDDLGRLQHLLIVAAQVESEEAFEEALAGPEE